MGWRSKHLDPADLAGLQKLVADKKSLQQLYQMDFSLPEPLIYEMSEGLFLFGHSDEIFAILEALWAITGK